MFHVQEGELSSLLIKLFHNAVSRFSCLSLMCLVLPKTIFIKNFDISYELSA